VASTQNAVISEAEARRVLNALHARHKSLHRRHPEKRWQGPKQFFRYAVELHAQPEEFPRRGCEIFRNEQVGFEFTEQLGTPRTPSAENPAGPPGPSGALFLNGRSPAWGLPMLSPERCRNRAAECREMAQNAPNPRVRNILLDISLTWTRLALEAEQWSQMNGPKARLTKTDPKTALREPTPPTHLPPRGSRRERH
jgi:hypothetical protein